MCTHCLRKFALEFQGRVGTFSLCVARGPVWPGTGWALATKRVLLMPLVLTNKQWLLLSMARLIQVLSVFSKIGVLSVEPPTFTRGCRFASRSSGAPWFGGRASNRASVYDQGMSGEDPGLEDVEDKLQALAEWVLKTVNYKHVLVRVVFTVTYSSVSREGRKRRQTVKFHMLRRRMTPSGAPQRKLTWSAIEQIRWAALYSPHCCCFFQTSLCMTLN